MIPVQHLARNGAVRLGHAFYRRLPLFVFLITGFSGAVRTDDGSIFSSTSDFLYVRGVKGLGLVIPWAHLG
jgi:hypothetical protein